MSFFGETEETTPLQEFLASTRDASTEMTSNETWKTAAKIAAAGAIVCGTYYAVSRMRSRSRTRGKLDKNGKPPPPLIGVPKSGKNADVIAVVTKPEGNRVKNQVTKVSHLTVFPIKSCRGVEVESFFCGELGPEIHTPHGIVRDRSWMVVTEKFAFLTQRRKPKMSLIQPAFDGECMVLSAPDTLPLRVPLSPDVSTLKTVTSEVWGQAVDAVDCGDEAGKWFSDYLQLAGLRFLYHPKSFGGRNRAASDKNVTDKQIWDEKDACTFADDSPYSVVSEESVNELSQHTPQPVPWIHFRPNIVVTGCPANSEDYWWRFGVGTDAEFRNTKLTPRCVETTVDPQTGTFARKDILETLKKVRMNQSPEWDDVYKFGPLFAIFVAVDKMGKISVGDYIVHIEDVQS